VSISIYFAVFVACILALDNTGFAPLALLCVLIHECGHIAVLLIFHVPIEKVSIRLFGINITLKNGVALSYSQETALDLSGSAANFVTCVPSALLYSSGIFPGQTGAIFAFSLMLGCFNLLPISSLDGGRALESALCRKTSCDKAEKIVGIISSVLIIPLAAAGIYVVILTGYNISLIAVAVYLAASLFLKNGFITPSRAKKTFNR